MSKKRSEPFNKAREMLYDKPNNKGYKRYRKAQYCYLSVKALISFIFGLFVGYILKIKGGII